VVNKVQLVFRKNNGDSFGTLGGLGYDSHLERRSRLIYTVVDPTVRHDNHSHIAACACMAGGLHPRDRWRERSN
jgi:hypothetical protein